MAKKKSEQMNAALAEAIVAQPVASVDAAVQELREAGLVAEADELAAVLAQRQQQLAEARAAKAAEKEAARQKAITAAKATFNDRVAEYVVLRDEALDSLAEYVELATPGIDAYSKMQKAAADLDRLTNEMVERPLSASDIFRKDERFKMVRHVNFNARPL